MEDHHDSISVTCVRSGRFGVLRHLRVVGDHRPRRRATNPATSRVCAAEQRPHAGDDCRGAVTGVRRNHAGNVAKGNIRSAHLRRPQRQHAPGRRARAARENDVPRIRSRSLRSNRRCKQGYTAVEKVNGKWTTGGRFRSATSTSRAACATRISAPSTSQWSVQLMLSVPVVD